MPLIKVLVRSIPASCWHCETTFLECRLKAHLVASCGSPANCRSYEPPVVAQTAEVDTKYDE